MRRLFDACSVGFRKSDDLAMFLSTITGASRFANILEGDWVEFVEVTPYPWEDNGIFWLCNWLTKHALAVIFVELDPFRRAECVPSGRLFELAADEFWDGEAFEDSKSNGFIRDGGPVTFVLQLVFTCVNCIKVVGNDI